MNSVPGGTVSVIGSGPYGLAIAAHLKFAGIDCRIFGSPMRRWRSQMPNAMLLKSEGCASGLPDPTGQLSLPRFCREHELSYAGYGAPISREIFTNYSLAFQQTLVPEVEDVLVTEINPANNGITLRLSNGETLPTAEVIVAIGMERMAHIPKQLDRLPAALLSHSEDHFDLRKFSGKHVAVIGAGQSGLETAALLREEGASVTLVVRAPTIAWNRIPSTERRTLYQRLRRPRTRLGEGLQLWVYDTAPLLFHALPQQLRLSRVKASLGPAGAWWLKDRVMGQLPIVLGHRIRAAEAQGGRVALQIAAPDGRNEQLIADHVIAATGYRFDVQKLPFLEPGLTSRIRREAGQPQLSTNFESSVPGCILPALPARIRSAR